MEIVTKERPDMVDEECRRIVGMIGDIEESAEGMEVRAGLYMEFLERKIKAN